MKKTKLWWVTRSGPETGYTIWGDKPRFHDGVWWGDYFLGLSDEDFEFMTGIKMKGGKDSIMCIKGFRPVKGER